ncbi:hypothetical protein E4U17_007305 [Claviceps sp. LM77 group G4]|nr:hypothetical protein E4U17_007305 [Claviceps sp. LM77 group G4]
MRASTPKENSPDPSHQTYAAPPGALPEDRRFSVANRPGVKVDLDRWITEVRRVMAERDAYKEQVGHLTDIAQTAEGAALTRHTSGVRGQGYFLSVWTRALSRAVLVSLLTVLFFFLFWWTRAISRAILFNLRNSFGVDMLSQAFREMVIELVLM